MRLLPQCSLWTACWRGWWMSTLTPSHSTLAFFLHYSAGVKRGAPSHYKLIDRTSSQKAKHVISFIPLWTQSIWILVRGAPLGQVLHTGVRWQTADMIALMSIPAEEQCQDACTLTHTREVTLIVPAVKWGCVSRTVLEMINAGALQRLSLFPQGACCPPAARFPPAVRESLQAGCLRSSSCRWTQS